MHRDNQTPVTLIPAPYPVPPVEARPTHFSASSLELLMRDPYGLYAKSVLKLRPLDPYEEEAGPRERGIFIHAVVSAFCHAFPKDMPDDAEAHFMRMATEIFERDYADPDLYADWWPRMESLAAAFIKEETAWRETGYRFARSETKGELHLPPYSFEATADRLDQHADGTYAVIDYKTGSQGKFTKTAISCGFLPQLPLEGHILAGNGSGEPVFNGLTPNTTSYMGYWFLGTKDGIKKNDMYSGDKAAEIVAETGICLENLMTAYQDPLRGYPSQPFAKQEPAYSRYDHLARILEWRAASGTDEGEAA
jgi:ATP-dependent helicase/nuclease subunit B